MKPNNLEMTVDQAATMRAKVKNAAALQTKASLDFAALLYSVFYGTTKNKRGDVVPLAEAWGYESFDDWVEHDLHWHQGTCRALVRVWDELFIRRSLPMDTLPDSIQQLRMLAKISARTETDGRELKKWITKSKELSCCGFEAEVEQEFGFGKGKSKNLGFTMPWNRAKIAKRIVDNARKTFGVSTRGEALDKILTDFDERTTKAHVSQQKTG